MSSVIELDSAGRILGADPEDKVQQVGARGKLVLQESHPIMSDMFGQCQGSMSARIPLQLCRLGWTVM